MSTKLPDKPSELLKIAMRDLELVEKDPNYKVNMTFYHTDLLRIEPDGPKYCYVCLAGAVMAKTLMLPLTEHLVAAQDEANKLYALNELRTGDIVDAFDWLGIGWPEKMLMDTPVTPYEQNQEQFKKDMQELITYLTENGY